MPLLRALIFALIIYVLSFLGLYWGVGVQLYEEESLKGQSAESESLYYDYGQPVFYVQLRNLARLPLDKQLSLNPAARCLSDWLAYLSGSKAYVLKYTDLMERVGNTLHQSPKLQPALSALMKADNQKELYKLLTYLSSMDEEADSLQIVFANAPIAWDHLWLIPQWVGDKSMCHQWLFSKDFNQRLAGSFSIWDGVQWSLALGVVSFVLTTFLGLVWGLIWASGKGNAVWQSLSLLIYSVPSFAWALLFLSVLLIVVDSWYWPMNDPGNLINLMVKNPLEVLLRLSLPAFCLCLMPSAYMAALWRGAIEQEKSKEYVRTARAKGLSENAILYRHVLRNSAFPALTASALVLPGMLTGSLVLESLFSIPGLGRLMHLAYLQRDFNTLLWIFPAVAASVVFLWQLMQVLYRTIDPRT